MRVLNIWGHGGSSDHNRRRNGGCVGCPLRNGMRIFSFGIGRGWILKACGSCVTGTKWMRRDFSRPQTFAGSRRQT